MLKTENLPNVNSEMTSILSSEDSILLRKKLKDNLERDFDNFNLFNRHPASGIPYSKLSIEELSNSSRNQTVGQMVNSLNE